MRRWIASPTASSPTRRNTDRKRSGRSYFAGTMGLVQRDGINRLRHVMQYSRQKHDDLHRAAGDRLARRRRRHAAASTRGRLAKSDLIVMWGGNPVSTQVNVMTHVTRARKERGAKFVVIDPYRTPTAAVADLHLAPRPGTDAALACAVMHIAFRDGYADRRLHGATTPTAPTRWRRICNPAARPGRRRSPASRSRQSRRSANSIGQTKRSFIRCGYGFARSRNGAAAMHAVVSPAGRHRRLAVRGRRRAVVEPQHVSLEQDADRGTGRASIPRIRELDMSRIASVLTGDRSGAAGWAAGHGDADPESESADRLPRQQPRAAWFRP